MVTSGAPPQPVAVAVGLRVDPTAPVPVQLTPLDGEVVKRTTRFAATTVTVQPVPGALGYLVEVLPVNSFSVGYSSSTAEIPITAPDALGGKWRVCALMQDGLRSNVSPWRTVSFAT
jgi:hypothetical protein